MAAWACRSARRAVGRVPREAGERGVRGADRDDLPQLAAQLHRPLPRRDGVAEPVGEIQIRGQGLEQCGAGGGVVLGMAERGLVEGHRLPVRPRAGGLGRGGGRVPQHPGDVTGRRGVVGEHARVPADRLQRIDHRRVQRPLGTGGGGLEHGGPGDLVPERDAATPAVHQAGAGQHPDRRRRHVQGVEQLAADRFGRARQQLQAAPGRRGQPGDPREHGVPDALRQRGLRLGEDLADEERVARRSGGGRRPRRARARRAARRRPTGSAASAAAGERPVRRRGHRAPGSRGDRRPARRGRTAPAAAAAPRSGGRGTARGPASPRRPSAGPPPRTRAGGNAGRPAPPRRSRAGRRCRATGPAPRRSARPRRRAAGRADGACSTSRTCPTAAAPAHDPLDEGAQQNGLADARLAGDEHDGAMTCEGTTSAVIEHVEGMLALQQPHPKKRRRSGPRCIRSETRAEDARPGTPLVAPPAGVDLARPHAPRFRPVAGSAACPRCSTRRC